MARKCACCDTPYTHIDLFYVSSADDYYCGFCHAETFYFADYDEGCLSVPGFYETVSRPKKITVSAQDKEGSQFEIEADGVLSVCIQHEIDHLDGKLFVDYLSSLKRNRIKD